MRNLTFLLFVCIFSVYSENMQSQTAKVNINVKKITIGSFINQVEKQTDYLFVYSKNEINTDESVAVSPGKKTVAAYLKEIFNRSDIKYSFENGYVTLTKKHAQQIIPLQQNQNKKITGIITDRQGEPIIGASVIVKGTTNGVITDINGKFTLSQMSDNSKLEVRYIGYKPQVLSVKGKSLLNVVLEEDTKVLNEVVVVGYGVQKKSDVTGAMIHVSEKELTTRPVSNALEAMQGKAAGVDITTNERPGEIGTINIRGVRSLSASNTPLYVVDGIPLMSNSGIETLNPKDIESIDVLKDASATAIYGSRGANGVVLVTTKQGESGKMSINYSGTVTFETLEDYSKMMNSSEYIDWRRWSYYYLNPAKYPRADQPTKENDYEIFLGASDPTAWSNIEKGWSGGTWDGSKVPTTDWCNMVKQTAITHEHTLSVSGGSEKVKGYASIGYLNNEGTVKGQSYYRYTTKFNLDINPTKWFEIGLNINGTFSKQQYGSSATSTGSLLKGLPQTLYAAATSLFPYAVPYDEDGNRIEYPGGDDKVKNIVDEWNHNQNERRLFRTIGSLFAQIDFGNIYTPLKGLRYRFNFGPDFRYYRNGTFRDEESQSSEGKNGASLTNKSDFSWTLDNLLYYDKEVGKHSFGLTLLQSATGYHYEESSLAAQGIPLNSAKWNALTKANISVLDDWSSSLVEKQLFSYMFRMNYDYNKKYLLTISGRWDGASQLAKGNKWAFFPSVAFGWRIDQEHFLEDIHWIDQMKLRIGVGTTGNSAIDPYQTKGAIVPFYYSFGTSLVAGDAASEPLTGTSVTMANQKLGWEKTTQYNVGLDFSILRGRISGVLDFYTSKTRDLLMAMSIPSLNGYTTSYANIGKTSNIGLDITLNTMNVKTKDFTWTTSINAAWQKDKIDELANGKQNDINNNWFIGESLGVIYGYQSAGLWKAEDAAEMAKFNANGHSFQIGMARPVDQNGDYKIDPNDDRVVIGHTRPRWTFGMNNIFDYKNIELSFMLYGRFGYTVDTGGEWQGGRYMQREINYYNENNTNADYQKPIYNIGGGDHYYRILGYKKGSFLKIRTISLGYNFPKSFVSRLNLSSLQIYAQAKNPGRIFSTIDFLELDASQAFTSTWNRGYTIGLNVGF